MILLCADSDLFAMDEVSLCMAVVLMECRRQIPDKDLGAMLGRSSIHCYFGN